MMFVPTETKYRTSKRSVRDCKGENFIFGGHFINMTSAIVHNTFYCQAQK